MLLRAELSRGVDSDKYFTKHLLQKHIQDYSNGEQVEVRDSPRWTRQAVFGKIVSSKKVTLY